MMEHQSEKFQTRCHRLDSTASLLENQILHFPLQCCKIHTPSHWMSMYCYDNTVDWHVQAELVP